MGFFKDFKDDLSEAVDELIPGQETEEKTEDILAVTPDTLDTDLDMENELSKLDGLLEKASVSMEKEVKNISADEEGAAIEGAANSTFASEDKTEKKESNMPVNNENKPAEVSKPQESTRPVYESAPASDENAVITSGMRIIGDLESTGSIEVEGTIKGNVRCNGKLTVTGVIDGNSTSSEFFADSAKVEGEIITSGTVKIGVGSVVIGNIAATSAVIAGAVKGDIDVQGPVVVDTSAVVMGNIKSRSVQINNGAVIEGFCSQSYAEVDVESVFA